MREKLVGSRTVLTTVMLLPISLTLRSSVACREEQKLTCVQSQHCIPLLCNLKTYKRVTENEPQSYSRSQWNCTSLQESGHFWTLFAARQIFTTPNLWGGHPHLCM